MRTRQAIQFIEKKQARFQGLDKSGKDDRRPTRRTNPGNVSRFDLLTHASVPGYLGSIQIVAVSVGLAFL